VRHSNRKILPVLAAELGSKFGLDHIRVAAAGVIASILPLLIALVFQVYLNRGLTAGAI
jgi:multiple sugar transport system permease protein